MREYLKRSGNAYESMTDSINFIGKYSDSRFQFPDIDSITDNGGIEADWFKPAYSGSEDFSELNAIQLYRAFNDTYDELSEMFLGVAIVEMGHMEKLSGLITKLGGNLIVNYTNEKLNESITNGMKDLKSALQEAIQGERDTIAEYERLKEMCNGVADSDTKEIALQLLNKLIADERKHIETFTNTLRSLGFSFSVGL